MNPEALPEPCAVTVTRIQLLASAPVMPRGWFGLLQYEYRDGKLVMVEVREKVKP